LSLYLRQLRIINFNVQQKGLFPHLFVNKSDTPLDYEGNIPNREYFNDLSEEEYINYCSNYNNKKWNLR
jgi:hypothetical protein